MKYSRGKSGNKKSGWSGLSHTVLANVSVRAAVLTLALGTLESATHGLAADTKMAHSSRELWSLSMMMEVNAFFFWVGGCVWGGGGGLVQAGKVTSFTGAGAFGVSSSSGLGVLFAHLHSQPTKIV